MADLLVVCITVYSENHMKHINIPCGQNAQFSNAKAGGIFSYHCAFNVQVCRVCSSYIVAV
jgi:hypothetical protein